MLPGPRAGHVRRTRLLDALDGALAIARLILVSAPAGAGKSTLLSAWLAEAPVASAWLVLEPADDDPARFLRRLAAAIDSLAPVAGGGSEAWLDRDEGIDAGLAVLLDRLDLVPGQAVLVLDDYHVLTAPPIHRLVGALLEHLPEPVRLAIATRADPPLPLARLRARGELLEVRTDGLRFTTEEGSSLFRDTLGVAVTEENVARLVDRTEGWAAGLQLAGLALQGQADPAAFVRGFGGTHRFVLDYLLEEVLDRQPAEVQQFLLENGLAVLDRLSGDLCDAVTLGGDGQTTLEALERANLFLVPLDDERRWYRYHHLFADLLQARLARRAPDLPPVLHARAARWHDARGLHREAVEHALAANDEALALATFLGHWREVAHGGELGVVLRWLERLPDGAVCAQPQVSLAYAWILALRQERLDEAAERVTDAERALQTSAPDRTAIRIQAACIRSALARSAGSYEAAADQAHHALALAAEHPATWEEAVLRGDAWVFLGYALQAGGRPDDALPAYEQAIPLLWQGRNPVGAASAILNAVRLYEEAGRIGEAARLCATAWDEAERRGILGTPAAALLHATRAEVALARGERVVAVREADEAARLAVLGGFFDSVRRVVALQARLRADARRAAGPWESNAGLVEPLTPRELEVLRMVAAGRSNRQIADALVVSLNTAKTHVHTLGGKLGAESRTHAVARARELGLLD